MLNVVTHFLIEASLHVLSESVSHMKISFHCFGYTHGVNLVVGHVRQMHAAPFAFRKWTLRVI